MLRAAQLDAHLLDRMRIEQAEKWARAAERDQRAGCRAPCKFFVVHFNRFAPGVSDAALRAAARRLVAAGELEEGQGRPLCWWLKRTAR